MLKAVLLATSMIVASPVLAQAAPSTSQGQTTSATIAPGAMQSTPSTQTTAPAQPTTADQATPATDQTAAAAPAGQPVSGGGIAQIVDTEWATYDVNGDGKLSETEFAAWMNKLKSASNPSLKPEAASTKQWNASAFAQADKDKSKSLTKTELTGFLSQGQS